MQLLRVQRRGLHRLERRFAAGRGGRVERLFAEDLHGVEVEPLCHRAVVRLKELVGRFDLLGIAAEQRDDAALRRAVAQQQELRPLHRPLAVADVARVDLLHQVAHLFQRVPLLLDQGTDGGGRLVGGTALHAGVIQRQLGQEVRLALVQPLFEVGAVIEEVVAGLEAVVSRRHHLFLILVKQLQHLLRGAVAGEPVDVVADGGVQRPEGLVQRVEVGRHLPQHVLVRALLLPDAAQQLPRFVELPGVGNDAGVQDLLQRFQQRGHLRLERQRRFLLVAAGLLFQPAGAPQPEQEAQRQQMRVAGGLLGLVPGVVSVQRQRLCQRRKIILRAGDGLGAGDAVICRVAALLPQQQEQLRIKGPVRPRQRAEQTRADQFKQLHQKILSFAKIRFYCTTNPRLCHKRAAKNTAPGGHGVWGAFLHDPFCMQHQ